MLINNVPLNQDLLYIGLQETSQETFLCFPVSFLQCEEKEMSASCLSSDSESVDPENFPEESMYPDYSQQRPKQVQTHLHHHIQTKYNVNLLMDLTNLLK